MSSLDELFKAYDVRGRVPDELTPEIAYCIGRAFADFLPTEGPVAIGRDMRQDSAELADSLIKGLSASGREVIDIGQVTSDMIYFAVGKYKLAGGAMVTASHNPGGYNGIKFCQADARPVGVETGLGQIRDLTKKYLMESATRTIPAAEKTGKQDIMEDWVEHVLSFAGDIRPYKVAVDAGNGMAGLVIPHLEKRLPITVTPLYFEPDGSFPNHEANPLKEENLQDLIKTVKQNQLDFGVAFDGDGDRAFLVDEKGEPLTGSVMAALLAEHFLKQNPGAPILYNAVCSRVVPETIERLGGQPVRTRVGHSFIKTKLRELESPFAGEHSGHYYFRDNFYADSGLIAVVVAMTALSASGLKLSELADKYRVYFQSSELNFKVANKAAVLEHIAGEFNDGEHDRLDGLTVNYPDWWFNVRPSNTEPLLRLNIEASTEELLEKNLSKLQDIITEQ